MSVRTMREAADIYTVASSANLVWDVVEHSLFQDFSVGLTKLERLLAEDKDDDIWREIRRILRRTRSTVSATPLPFNHTALGVARACYDIAPWATRARAQYSGESIDMLTQLVALLESISTSPDNPLGDRVVVLGSGAGGGAGLLLPVARHKDPVLRFVRSIDSLFGMDVVTPGELADRPPYAGLLVAGSLQWYRHARHVAASPRAHVVHLLRWSWIRDALPERSLFTASRLGTQVRADSPSISTSNHSPLDGRDLVPQIDWNAIADTVGAAPETRQVEAVPARILMLADGRAVAVSDARGTIHVVEPELEGPKRIRETEVRDLEVGDFVLLRSQGGGDLVVEVADQMLGASAPSLRIIQHEWKTALRARVIASTRPVAQLRALGAVRANAQNLRNWMSPRSLKTANVEDFAGIMKFIGREHDTGRFWGAMQELENAHRRAGHIIRQMLIRVVAEADLRQLETDGSMEFQLETKDGGSLTAFRVDGIAPDLVDIAEHRIGRLVDAGDLWLE